MAGASASNPRIYMVSLNWRHRARCDDLPPEALADLQRVLDKTHWPLAVGFRQKPLGRLQAWREKHGGASIVFYRSSIARELPPVFDEAFEAIELGTRDPALRTLTGSHATREENAQRFALTLAVAIAVVFSSIALISLFFGSRTVATALLFVPLAIVIGVVLGHFLQAISPRWLLVPGGVVIAQRRRGELISELLTPQTTIAFLGDQHAHNHRIRYLRLCTRTRAYRRNLSQREQLAFLAAWPSPVPPPRLHEIRELLH